MGVVGGDHQDVVQRDRVSLALPIGPPGAGGRLLDEALHLGDFLVGLNDNDPRVIQTLEIYAKPGWTGLEDGRAMSWSELR